MTDHDFERQVRANLRETLDRELGPDPTWAESPAARRVAEMERRRRRRWPMRVLAVAALIGALAVLRPCSAGAGRPAAGDPRRDQRLDRVRRCAGGSGRRRSDTDIWFAALDQEPRRVIGTDTDSVDQLCPAFSPDGRSLAYGSVEGVGSERDAELGGHAIGTPRWSSPMWPTTEPSPIG